MIDGRGGPNTSESSQDAIGALHCRRTSHSHHEIYISDFRRESAEKRKTIPRFAVERM